MIAQLINTNEFQSIQLEKIKNSYILLLENENQKSANELHDDFGQHLILIKYLFESYTRENNCNLLLKKEIIDCINELYMKLRDIIDNKSIVNNKNINLNDFLEKTERRINQIKQSYLHVNMDNALSEKYFDELPQPILINLIRIIQEFINNTIKHSLATGVSISFFTYKHKGCVLLNDNGQGFSVNSVKRGNGLKNIFWRLQLMQSHYSYVSNIEGTSLFIEL